MSEYIRTNKFDTNECPNIFVKEKLIRTNVRIYIRDQYIRIFEYSNIVVTLCTEIGDWPFLKFNSSVTICLVLHTCKYYVWSVWSPRPDQTRVSNYKMYLSQIAICICLKLQNVFVSNCKM